MKSILRGTILGFLAAWSVAGCGSKEEAAPEQAPLDVGPPVGALELPVSLRTGDAAPTDARKVEVSLAGVRVDDQPLLALDNGKVKAEDRSGDELPKLKAALASPAKSTLALTVHSSLPYTTAALVLQSAKSAGISKLALHVRKPGGSTSDGWLQVQSFQTTPRTDDDVPIASVQPRTWDEFAAAWGAIGEACRSAQTGSCAYEQNSVAKGGTLKIVLFAAGQGVNVNFYRVGLTPEQLAAEDAARKAELATKKEDFIQGRAGKKDLVAELTEGEPATDASFQFRAREAFDSPSPVTAMMQPLCGPKACGAVVSADEPTLMVRVVSLIGAAFADGSVAPALAFELPWTKKPVPPPAPVAAPPPPPPAEPAAPAHKAKGKPKHK